MKLFRCDRLSASISIEQCRKNKSGQPGRGGRRGFPPRFACEGCPGLGDLVTINQEEIMASKCKNNCGKLAQHGKDGLCCTCYSEKNKPAAPPATVTPSKVVSKPATGHKFCSEPGCTKQVTRQRLCWNHLKARGIDPKTGKPISIPQPVSDVDKVLAHVEKAAKVQVREVTDLTPPNEIEQSSQPPSNIDALILAALRDAYQQKEREWLADLHGLNPCQMIVRAAGTVQQLEGLGR